MQVPQAFWRVQPVQPPCRVSSEPAAAASRRSPSAPSVSRLTWGSRPTLQMDALPCGSAWKWVIPAPQLMEMAQIVRRLPSRL